MFLVMEQLVLSRLGRLGNQFRVMSFKQLTKVTVYFNELLIEEIYYAISRST